MVRFFSWLGLMVLVASCTSNKGSDNTMASHENAGAFDEGAVALVKVTNVIRKIVADTIALPGTTEFLKKISIESPISGYVKSVNVNVGDAVSMNETMMTLQTKESAAYGTSKQDSFFTGGIIPVRSEYNNYIVTFIHDQPGQYVQEGAALIELVDPASIVVALNVPFEMNALFQPGKKCDVQFSDHSIASATVWKKLPQVDSSSQTQSCLLKLDVRRMLPENLTVMAHALKSAPHIAIILPEKAILTNETQDQFWVMKLINDSTAVKVAVTTGMQHADSVEIIAPEFSQGDRILVSGNYGLTDTAKVKVETK